MSKSLTLDFPVQSLEAQVRVITQPKLAHRASKHLKFFISVLCIMLKLLMSLHLELYWFCLQQGFRRSITPTSKTIASSSFKKIQTLSGKTIPIGMKTSICRLNLRTLFKKCLRYGQLTDWQFKRSSITHGSKPIQQHKRKWLMNSLGGKTLPPSAKLSKSRCKSSNSSKH
jgi:hypothetical protein